MPLPPSPTCRPGPWAAGLALIIIFSAATIGVAAPAPASPSRSTGTASVTLAARWGPTPYVLEAVEFLVR